MEKIIAKKYLTPEQAEDLKGTFLDHRHYDTVITSDCDAYDTSGQLLFRFRKGAIPMDLLKLGYESFKDSIQVTDGRGMAAGKPFKRVRQDGTVSNITVSNKVNSGNVGYMDKNAMVHYCRKTAFAKEHFELFQKGLPFVKCVDTLYSQLCPEHYKKQLAIAKGTNRNYVIEGTSFTTVTVNRNFQTAVHKDAGDYPKGFGNLCVYREGHYEGSYFCLPEYRIAIDMHNTDILFVDVHRFHGNTPFINCSADYLRIAFVMYYREYMYLCKQPADELKHIKQEETGFLRL